MKALVTFNHFLLDGILLIIMTQFTLEHPNAKRSESSVSTASTSFLFFLGKSTEHLPQMGPQCILFPFREEP